MKDWQVGTVLQYQSGQLLTVPASNNGLVTQLRLNTLPGGGSALNPMNYTNGASFWAKGFDPNGKFNVNGMTVNGHVFGGGSGLDFQWGSGATAETVDGLGNRKNELVLRMIHTDGVAPYEGSVRYVEAARAAGLRRAVVSSSTNCRDVLKAAGIFDLFEEIVDGHVAEREHLKGKPAPDTFLAGARAVGVGPDQSAVFEDALAGVQAGRDGNFAFVVGVDRVGQADALKEHGASAVVRDLAELLEDR